MTETSEFLRKQKNTIEKHIEAIYAYLRNNKIKNVAWNYSERKSSREEEPFNVFRLVSDRYYRETFHSDIIKAFLDPNEKHKGGNLYLFSFIDFLNECFSNKIYISKQNYTNAIVAREPGRIDILIKSETSKHCIIIENKLYNANDTERQLPKYYDWMTERGFTVDAIVYIPLNENKVPDKSTWIGDDEKHVDVLLCIVPGYSRRRFNLVENWLKPCAMLSGDIDCISILRQYGKLIKTLSNNNMDNMLFEKFYNSLLEDDNYKVAMSVKEMLQQLPIYMADRLCEEFKKNEGDYKVWKYKDNFCGICYKINDVQYKIDIWTSEKGYSIYVFGQDQMGERLIGWTKNIKSLTVYGFINNVDKEYMKDNYSFYQEKDVINCVKDIMSDIKEYLEICNKQS